MISIDPTARVSPLADIEDSTRGTRVIIGANVFIDAFVKIKTVGGRGDVVIGPNCSINSGTVLYSGNGINLGEGVLVAANCVFAPVNHEYRHRDQPIREQGFLPSQGGILVGDDCWFGSGTVILDGAKIGKGSVIGALSLVRGTLPEHSISHGIPAVPTGVRG